MRRARVSLLAIAVGLTAATAAAPALARPPDTSGTPVVDGVPLCGVARGRGATEARPNDVLKVATYNLLHSDTDEGDLSLGARLPLEAKVIADGRADVVGVQEATRNGALDPADEYPQKHGFVVSRLAQELARRTGQTWEWCWSQSNPHVPGTPDVEPGGGNPLDDEAAAFGNFPDPGDFREGLGILTRFHITQARFRHLLPRSYEAVACITPDPLCRLDAAFDSRQVLWARIRTPRGPVDMFTTHLAHEVTPLSDTTKLLQVHQALQIVDQWATKDRWPDFLVGDFNSNPSTDRHRAMVDAHFVDTYRAAGGVECAASGGRGCTGDPPVGQEVFTSSNKRVMSERIDYVWALPPASCRLRVPGSRIAGDVPRLLPDHRWLWPSDHLSVVSAVSC